MNQTPIDEDGKFNVNKFFKSPVCKPFYYNLNFHTETSDQFFTKIKDIFIKGLIIHAGDEEKNSVNINDVTPNDIKKVSDYMLSMGYKTTFTEFNQDDKTYAIRSFLYDVDKLPDLDIQLVIGWPNEEIRGVKMTVLNNNMDTLRKLKKISILHPIANHILKIRPKIQLKDYFIFINHPKITHMITFDHAKPSDYEIVGGCRFNVNALTKT